MAQVMVNFRIDEDIKRQMEQACREMGLSMTTAFTIFATKVGKEKRIPFEITAAPYSAASPQRRRGSPPPPRGEEPDALAQKQEQLELLCAKIRRSLTAIHIAIPASVTGLDMERVRLLCGDELKDKAAAASSACKALSSAKNKDLSILDRYTEGLSAIAEELLDLERTLIPAMKLGSGTEPGGFAPYGQRLAAVSRRFDELTPVMQRFLSSTACVSGAQTLMARVRRAAEPVRTPYVLTALENLEALIRQHGGHLEDQTLDRLESDYLQTLELTLAELAQAEREGGDVGGRAALCLRAANVLAQVISDGGLARQEWRQRSLEAEVEALERLAAMRGDIPGGVRPKE